MRRSKALPVVAVLVVAVGLGATAASARTTSAKALCANYAKKQPTPSWATSLICPTKKRAAAQDGNQLLELNHQIAVAINNFRKAHGLHTLTMSPQLNASSRQHSEEMGADGYFEHNSADGTAWWKRIQHYYGTKGYTYWTAGENLLFDTPTVDAATAMKMWIASPEHLRNLKDPNWRNLGVSAVHVVDAGGVYGGYTVTIITTDFGARH
jgi:uncharacterized protein YkwD